MFCPLTRSLLMTTGICLSWFTGLSTVQAQSTDPPVTFKETAGGADVMIRGELFTSLHIGPEWAKPFLAPAHAPGGAIITRIVGDTDDRDHPHHKGIWFSVDEVNEVKFWAEAGKILNVKVETVEGNPGKIKLKNHWLGKDELPILIETTTISIFPSRLVIYDATFTAAGAKVTFEDTKEGLFGIRVATTMREKVGGVIVNAEGKSGTKECWGQTSKWVDYTGPVNGKLYGMTMMDHPGNFRPSRYHVRDYGLFSISPFGEGAYQNDKAKAQPVTLDPGKSLQLCYGLYVHEGDAAAGKVAEAYEQFLGVQK